ncbi:hypothetical protein CLF_108487, partial [Clonorchis sinensis]
RSRSSTLCSLTETDTTEEHAAPSQNVKEKQPPQNASQSLRATYITHGFYALRNYLQGTFCVRKLPYMETPRHNFFPKDISKERLCRQHCAMDEKDSLFIRKKSVDTLAETWMLKPTVPGCSSGLEYLAQLDQLFVKQKKDLIEGGIIIIFNYTSSNNIEVNPRNFSVGVVNVIALDQPRMQTPIIVGLLRFYRRSQKVFFHLVGLLIKSLSV